MATVKMSEAVDNMYAYTHLTDSVLQLIKLYPQEAMDLLVKDITNAEERAVWTDTNIMYEYCGE